VYSDTFDITTADGRLTARRTDRNYGWGMNLKIKCCDNRVVCSLKDVELLENPNEFKGGVQVFSTTSVNTCKATTDTQQTISLGNAECKAKYCQDPLYNPLIGYTFTTLDFKAPDTYALAWKLDTFYEKTAVAGVLSKYGFPVANVTRSGNLFYTPVAPEPLETLNTTKLLRPNEVFSMSQGRVVYEIPATYLKASYNFLCNSPTKPNWVSRTIPGSVRFQARRYEQAKVREWNYQFASAQECEAGLQCVVKPIPQTFPSFTQAEQQQSMDECNPSKPKDPTAVLVQKNTTGGIPCSGLVQGLKFQPLSTAVTCLSQDAPQPTNAALKENRTSIWAATKLQSWAVCPEGSFVSDLSTAAGQKQLQGHCKQVSDTNEYDDCYIQSNCNWQCYLDRYSDLQQAFGKNNLEAARNHYFEYGMTEGRSCSCKLGSIQCKPGFAVAGLYHDISYGVYKNISGLGTKCSMANQICTCTGKVSYGANGRYISKVNNAASISCSKQEFGGDPIYGVPKACYCLKSQSDLLTKLKCCRPKLLTTQAAVKMVADARLKAIGGNQDVTYSQFQKLCQVQFPAANSADDKEAQAAIKEYACTVVQGMDSGLDAFGFGASEVTPLSWDAYEDLLDSSTKILDSIGTEQQFVASQISQQISLQDKISEVQNKLSTQLNQVSTTLAGSIEKNREFIVNNGNQLKEVRGELHTIRSDILDVKNDLGQKLTDVLVELDDLKEVSQQQIDYLKGITSSTAELNTKVTELKRAEQCRYLKNSMRTNGIQLTSEKILKTVTPPKCNFWCKIGGFFKSALSFVTGGLSDLVIEGVAAAISGIGDHLAAKKCGQSSETKKLKERFGYAWNPYEDLSQDPSGTNCDAAVQAVLGPLTGSCEGNLIWDTINEASPEAGSFLQGFLGSRRRLLAETPAGKAVNMFVALFHSYRDRVLVEESLSLDPMNATFQGYPRAFVAPEKVAMYTKYAMKYVNNNGTGTSKPSSGDLQSLAIGSVQTQLLVRSSIRNQMELNLASLERAMQTKTISHSLSATSSLADVQASLNSLCMSVTARAIGVLSRMRRQFEFWALEDLSIAFPDNIDSSSCSNVVRAIYGVRGKILDAKVRKDEGLATRGDKEWWHLTFEQSKFPTAFQQLVSNRRASFDISPPEGSSVLYRRKVGVKSVNVYLLPSPSQPASVYLRIYKQPLSVYFDDDTSARSWTFIHAVDQHSFKYLTNDCASPGDHLKDDTTWASSERTIRYSPYGTWGVEVVDGPTDLSAVKSVRFEIQLEFIPAAGSSALFSKEVKANYFATVSQLGMEKCSTSAQTLVPTSSNPPPTSSNLSPTMAAPTSSNSSPTTAPGTTLSPSMAPGTTLPPSMPAGAVSAAGHNCAQLGLLIASTLYTLVLCHVAM